MIIWWVAAVPAVSALLGFVVLYNRLVALVNNVEQRWSDMHDGASRFVPRISW